MNKKNRILNARSKENGIVFYSNKIPMLCYEAHYDEKGEIQTRVQTSAGQEREDQYGMLLPFQTAKSLKEQVMYSKSVMLLLAVVFGIAMKNIFISLAFIYYSICISINMVGFANTVWKIKFGRYKATGRFHSAEHMVTKAYEKYGRVPTMAELKRESRFSRYCGSRVEIFRIVYSICVGLIVVSYAYIPYYEYLIEIAILILFTVLNIKFNLLRFFQILVTNKPTEKELEVALAGIELFDELDSGFPEFGMPAGIIVLGIVPDVSESEEKLAD